MADVFGFSVPLFGGGLLLGVSGLCLLQLRRSAKAVYAPIALLLLCATSFVAIQIVIHGESLAHGQVRSAVTWMLGLVVVQSLQLRRGFLHRFAVFLFVLGIVTVPYLTFTEAGVERARIGLQVGANLSHSGGLAEWFGFCAVYFAVLGLVHKQLPVRVVAWSVGVGSLFIVGLTVSRGALLAVFLAITISFRDLLRRGFIPIVLLIVVAGVTYESGLFEQVISHYYERGTEETGRGQLWPAAIERFVQSPFVGVGVSNIATYMPDRRAPIASPHNSFLYFALSAGILPAAFFVGFWVRAIRRSLSHVGRLGDGVFRLPFLAFALSIAIFGDLGFLSPWGLLALSVGAGSGVSDRMTRIAVPRRPGVVHTAPRTGRTVRTVRYRVT